MSTARLRTSRPAPRRQPQQRRARETVDAVLDAVAKILCRDGVGAVTTNRIAAVAGVSIGSVYQYFPDKRAIFTALHDRHVAAIGRLVEATLVAHAAAPPDAMIRALIEAMITAHTADPSLHELLSTQVPHDADADRTFEARLRGAFRLALAATVDESALDRTVFVLANMVEALTHAAVLRRPARVSLAAARDETVKAALAYLRG